MLKPPAAREGGPGMEPLAELAGHRDLATPHGVARRESEPVGVAVGRIPLLQPQPCRQRRAPPDPAVDLAVAGDARRPVPAVQRALEDVFEVATVVPLGVVLLEPQEVSTGDPVPVIARASGRPEVLAQYAALALGQGEEVVGPGVAPECVVTPVAVEARHDGRVRPARDAAQPEAVRDIPGDVCGGARGTLRVAAGPIRLRHQRVVDREGVVAVVEIGVHERQVGGPAVRGEQPDAQTGRQLVALVGVVALEERVAPEPVAHRPL